MDDNYIASGAYGEVYKIDNNRAIKKFGSLNELIHEICIYKYIGPCEKITKLLDYNIENKTITMELYHMNCGQWLNNPNVDNSIKKSINDKEAVIRDLIYGVMFLHDKNIVHADIKPGNILLKFDANGKIQKSVLCDFGCSGLEEYAFYNRTTERYRSLKDKNGKNKDIYSLGITLDDIYQKQIPDNYKQLIRRMSSEKSIKDRPTIKEIYLTYNKNRSMSLPLISTEELMYDMDKKLSVKRKYRNVTISHTNTLGTNLLVTGIKTIRSKSGTKIKSKKKSKIDKIKNKDIVKYIRNNYIDKKFKKDKNKDCINLTNFYISSCLFGGKYHELDYLEDLYKKDKNCDYISIIKELLNSQDYINMLFN